MTSRFAPYACFGAATFAAMVSLLAGLAMHGFASDGALEMWGRAIAAREGALTMREFIAAFPPMPFFLTFTTQMIAPVDALLGPGLVAAFTAALLVTLWFSSFVKSGYHAGEALLLVVLLVANPLFLRLVTGGPGEALLILNAWWVATAAYRLRARAVFSIS